MNTSQPWSAETHQTTVDLMVAFLENRLEEKETIEWALDPGSIAEQKRRAILRLLNPPWEFSLREPWHSAWQLIQESWQGETDDRDKMPLAKIKQRLASGDRSEALILAIVKLVAPRLVVEPYESWQREIYTIAERPKSLRDLFHVKLTSGDLVDPISLGLEHIRERDFIDSLARALDAAVLHGLNIAVQNELVQPHFFLRRVYYVPESGRGDIVHEPDEFRTKISASVKLLFSAVVRLFDLDRSAATAIVRRWKQADSPIYLRLWAAMSHDSRTSSASEVGEFLLGLDDIVFWDTDHHPEIAELRARRFSQLNDAMQAAIITRIRRKPPRNLWRRNAQVDRINEVRLYWVARELKRIQVAGGTLELRDENWLKTNINRFSDLAQMNRVGEQFSRPVETQRVAGDPEPLLDFLDGVDRLRVMEQALAAPRPNWGDSQGDRAGEWIKRSDNSLRILEDFEASPGAGAEFPRTWELFGWRHRPPHDNDVETINRDSLTETRRVMRLIAVLSDETMSIAITGISHWMSRWERYVAAAPNWSAVWLRAWPFAVEFTNKSQEPYVVPDLNVFVDSEVDQKDDLDVLNPPSGKLVSVFLEALDGIRRPFDTPGELQSVRDEVINATGHSGLIAKHLMIESLGYFLDADRKWTIEHLVQPLRKNDAGALELWRALSRRTQSKDVLCVIGDDLISRTIDYRLYRATRGSLAFSVVIESLHALWENRKPAVAQERVQQMIRSLDDEVRAECARAIIRYVSKLAERREKNPDPPSPERLYRCSVRPFLRQVWPKERSLASPGVSEELARLPVIARGEFADAVAAIERFLVPFECWSMFDYGFEKDRQMETPVIVDDMEKAKALLRLLDRTIGTAEEAIVPHNLGDALEQVRNVAPTLARTPEYRRLETAASRA